MKPEHVKTDRSNAQSMQDTNCSDTTSDAVDEAIGRIKGYPTATFTGERECVRVIESLKKLGFGQASATTELASRVGEQIAEYRLVRLLGRGGMGEVYYAEHVRLGRAFALKVMHPDRLGNKRMAARFEREMKAVGQLDHENLVKATGAGCIDDDLFLAMEYIDGQTLADVVRNSADGRLGIDEACGVIRQACAGLQYVHEHGIVHRDIKPANLMRDNSGRVRVLDLGLARMESSLSSDEELTTEHQTMGTVDYMAPEQLRDSRQVDSRTDVYSLGATFYKLLTGRAPFADEAHPTAASRMAAIALEDPPPIKVFRPEIPDELAKVVDRMVARDPEGRPQSMAEVAEILDRIMTGRLETQRAAEPVLSTGSRWLGRLPWVAAALVLLLLAAAPMVIRLQDPGHGDLLITAAADVEVTIRESDGAERKLQLQAGRNQPISVRSGEFEILFTGANADEFDWNPEHTSLVMKRGEEFRASIERKSMIAGTVPANAAGLPPGGWPIDKLNRADIDPYELSVAGGGDPKKAAKEIVAIFGDSRFKHASIVQGLSFSSDHRRLLSFAGDKTVLWDVETGKALKYFPGCTAAALTPDGALLALDDYWNDKEILVFETESGRLLNRLGGRENTLLLRFEPDGQTLACVGGDGAVRFWNVRKVGVTRTGFKHNGKLYSAAFSHDGKRLATAGSDKVVRTWDMESGKEVLALPEFDTLVFALEFGPDAETLYRSGPWHFDKWRLDGEPRRKRLSTMQGCCAIRFDSTHGLIAVGGGADVQLWDAQSQKLLTTLKGHARTVTALTFSADGGMLASAGQGGTIKLWDVPARRLKNDFVERSGTAATVAVSFRSESLATGFDDGTVEVRDLATGKQVCSVSPDSTALRSIDFSPNGDSLAVAYQSGELYVVNSPSGEVKAKWKPHASYALALRFSPDGKVLATCSHRGVKLWDVASGRLQHLLSVDQQSVSALDFSPDGKKLAALGHDSGLCIWSVDTGELLRSKPTLRAAPASVAFSPDGSMICAAIRNTVFVWEVATLKESQTQDNHEILMSIAFSPDSRTIVGATNVGSVKLWTMKPGAGKESANTFAAWQTIHVLPRGVINQSLITPDGRHIIAANHNGTVTVLRIPQMATRR